MPSVGAVSCVLSCTMSMWAVGGRGWLCRCCAPRCHQRAVGAAQLPSSYGEVAQSKALRVAVLSFDQLVTAISTQPQPRAVHTYTSSRPARPASTLHTNACTCLLAAVARKVITMVVANRICTFTLERGSHITCRQAASTPCTHYPAVACRARSPAHVATCRRPARKHRAPVCRCSTGARTPRRRCEQRVHAWAGVIGRAVAGTCGRHIVLT